MPDPNAMQQQQHLIWQADSAIQDLESGGSGVLDMDAMLQTMGDMDEGSLLEGLEDCFALSDLDNLGELDNLGLEDGPQ